VVRLPIVLQLVNAQSASEDRSADLQSDRRVLVADDNEDSAQSLAMMLKMMGSETKTAHDGVEALEVGAAFEPHLVLLDIGMPRMNGYDTARRMRQESWGGSAMLVAMTGWGRDIDKRRSQEAGFDEHLVKPIEMEALEMILKKTQAQGQGQGAQTA
jgi:CheY-like chemotaxis protein